MTKVIVNIDGEKVTAKKINMFDMEKKKEATVAIRKHATAVRKAGKQNAPVTPPHVRKKYGNPGDLKKSIRVKYYYGGLGALIMPWKPKGSHRFIVELGTINRVNRRGQNRGRVRPKPFMAPAKEQQIGAYNRDMKRIFVDKKIEI